MIVWTAIWAQKLGGRLSRQRYTSKTNERLGTAPLKKLMLELAIPTVLAQTVNLLYNMVDRVFVGRIPGEGSIVENGFGAIDVLNSDHTCDGSYRIDYLKAHIEFAAYSGV